MPSCRIAPQSHQTCIALEIRSTRPGKPQVWQPHWGARYHKPVKTERSAAWSGKLEMRPTSGPNQPEVKSNDAAQADSNFMWNTVTPEAVGVLCTRALNNLRCLAQIQLSLVIASKASLESPVFQGRRLMTTQPGPVFRFPAAPTSKKHPWPRPRRLPKSIAI